MDVFAPNIALDPNDATGVNGSNVKTNTPDTTLGSTVNYIIDANGIARSPQSQERATSLGLNAVSAFEGGVALGAGAQSVAIGCTSLGTNSVSKVASATAVGDQAQATAYRAIALGKCSNSTGLNSIAIGSLSYASGQNGTSIGNSSTSSGADSLALGNGAIASGANSVAVGKNAQATGDSSVSIGRDTLASGASGTAVGANSFATGDSSTALGRSTIAVGNKSVAIGTGSRTVNANEFVAGSEGIYAITDVFFGQGGSVGVVAATVGNYTIHGEQDVRADKAGGDVILAGGRGTGTGRGGAFRIQTSAATTTGTTLGTLTDRVNVPARKLLTNNTTTELFRFTINTGTSACFEVKVGLQITDLTNSVAYSSTANVAATHDGGGYLSTITETGVAVQLGGGGAGLAVTLSITQPSANILAMNIKSNTTGITPSTTACYYAVIGGFPFDLTIV